MYDCAGTSNLGFEFFGFSLKGNPRTKLGKAVSRTAVLSACYSRFTHEQDFLGQGQNLLEAAQEADE
jgi:hypothetical protein